MGSEMCIRDSLLTKQSVNITTYTLSDDVEISPSSRTIAIKKGDLKWLLKLIPILCISIFATAIFSLLQSALPIDLVIGGISRPPIQEGWSAAILALQLGLLVILQWPIGSWLSFHKQSFGLGISIYNFFLGCLLLSISSIWPEGICRNSFDGVSLVFFGLP